MWKLGGKKLYTTVDTLTQREPYSMLATMFSGWHTVCQDPEMGLMEEINAVLSRKLDFEVLNFLALIFQNWICLMWTSSMLVLEMYSSHVQTYSVPSSGMWMLRVRSFIMQFCKNVNLQGPICAELY
ncbi:uncharacterized protein LOC133785246 [Humulus lupulus]|uniref:uncharacterized protein LOC133785246 n=1 Tax=Humulus lupulus TaxID=3486 RepID=UPI002B40BC36|nr:uncharacterized protein LOC133785246 [Humulus lupulus]